MIEDIGASLRRLHEHACELRDQLAATQADLPVRVEGTDASGTVVVVLGPDGQPESPTVRADWRGRLAAEAFGEAVVQAGQAAAGHRLTAWSQAWEAETGPTAGGRTADRTGGLPLVVADSGPAGLDRAVAQARPRALEHLVE